MGLRWDSWDVEAKYNALRKELGNVEEKSRPMAVYVVYFDRTRFRVAEGIPHSISRECIKLGGWSYTELGTTIFRDDWDENPLKKISLIQLRDFMRFDSRKFD